MCLTTHLDHRLLNYLLTSGLDWVWVLTVLSARGERDNQLIMTWKCECDSCLFFHDKSGSPFMYVLQQKEWMSEHLLLCPASDFSNPLFTAYPISLPLCRGMKSCVLFRFRINRETWNGGRSISSWSSSLLHCHHTELLSIPFSLQSLEMKEAFSFLPWTS